jgi:hypothetical protein
LSNVIFDSGLCATAIKIAVVNNVPYTKVQVNGLSDLWFLLDTAAEGSAIDIRHQERLGIDLAVVKKVPRRQGHRISILGAGDSDFTGNTSNGCQNLFRRF